MNLKRHKALCKICQHPKRKEIEMLYLHCLPYRTIQKRYNLYPRDISKHAKATGLDKKRETMPWYWMFIEQFKFQKITPEIALKASFYLDRLQGKLKPKKFSPPAKIELIFNHHKELGK